MKRHCSCIAVSCFVLTVLVSPAALIFSADEQPSMRQIVQISKNHAKHALPLHWKCVRKDGFYRDEKQLSLATLDSQGQIAECEVLFDPISLKCNVREKRTFRWIDGLSDYGSSDMHYAFDATTYQGWKREMGGKEIPPEGTIGQGQISKNSSDMDTDTKFFLMPEDSTKVSYQGSRDLFLHKLTHTTVWSGFTTFLNDGKKKKELI